MQYNCIIYVYTHVHVYAPAMEAAALTAFMAWLRAWQHKTKDHIAHL